MVLARSRPVLSFAAALVVDALAVRRGGRLVLDDIGFALRPGEALAVLGRNGAGKSTLLRALAGLLPWAAGTATVAGAPPAEHVHYLGHADGLKGALTGAENLRFAAALLGGAAAGSGAEAALDRLGLGHLADLPVGDLSAGQRRRIALARLLVAPRPVWLLDEPTTALDTAAAAALADVMAEHREAGGIVVVATHAPLGLDGAAELRLAA